MIDSKNSEPVSLHIKKLMAVSGKVVKPMSGFLVKNISGGNLTLSVKMKDSNEYIETVFYPGWNPELIDEIEDVEENKIQIGY